MIDVMARKVSVVTTDDLDGSPEAAIVSFGLDGVSYEIDLAAANKTRLANLVAPAVPIPLERCAAPAAEAGHRSRPPVSDRAAWPARPSPFRT